MLFFVVKKAPKPRKDLPQLENGGYFRLPTGTEVKSVPSTTAVTYKDATQVYLVKMVSISEVKSSNARISKDTAPYTAVFTGGTDGIGKATLTRLVSTKLPMRVYVIGRNGEKHKQFLDELRTSNEKANIVWLEGQISLLADTKRLCDIIKSRETSIDILFMSAGFINNGERVETSEGNAISLSLGYYSRTTTMIELLPLLNASSNNPRVLTILAAGNETSSIYLDDLDLKKPGRFSLATLSKSSASYTTLSMARLARDYPRVVLIHHYPGGVNTGLFKKAFGEKWFWPIFSLLLAVFGTSPEVAAEKAVYLLTSAKYGGKGVSLGGKEHAAVPMALGSQPGTLFLINDKLQELQQEKVMDELNRMDAGKLVWEHAIEIIGRCTA